jgi:hypothetical protein
MTPELSTRTLLPANAVTRSLLRIFAVVLVEE